MTTHFVTWGGGQPVVLLHGLGGDVDFWTETAVALAPQFRVIAVDLRGSGGTPSGPGGHTIDDLADDVVSVLDSLGVDVTDVVGFSMGGLVAQSMAARYPDRVHRLVLASTYAVMNPQATLFLDAVRKVVVATNSARFVFDLVCPWLFSLSFLGDPANAAMLTSADDDESPDGWLAQYQAQRDFDGTATLSAISAPTLVLAGAEDRLVTDTDIAVLADGIPDATTRVYEGCGHLINIEAPQRFLDDVRDFLSSTS